MASTFLLQIFHALLPGEHPSVRKFLQSPFFNSRSDVLDLFDLLVQAQRRGTLASLEKAAIFARLYPSKPYNNLNLNHVFTYLCERLEQYLSFVEMQRDGRSEQLYRVRAFRRRGLTQLFERDAAILEKEHAASPKRHAGWHFFQYQLQQELFTQRVIQHRSGDNNLQLTVDALGQFFLLENLRWACTAHSLRALGGSTYQLPLSEAVRAAAAVAAPDHPAIALLDNSLRALKDPDDEAAFHRIKSLLDQYPNLFPPAESRDIYMSAINFCIRRQNRGERSYAREALALYRSALTRGILLENDVLPKYTYNNIHMLAQVSGERDWARTFLDEYRDKLPSAERENIFRYNLAVFHYRAGEHQKVLEFLAAVEFSEVFINLDVRRMLLISYYELQEWSALASLLDSFKAYLRRKKDLGYHRDSYLNLIRFTQKMMKSVGKRDVTGRRLALQIKATEAVAEREWLLGKVE
jgi:hypothetical protein